MKIYLINLDRSTDRLARMSKIFEELKLLYQRVSAVDGRNYNSGEADAFRRQRPDEAPMTPSEIGCYYSHRKCFKLIADGPDQFAAIFEDDAVLSPDISAWLSNTHWLPANADIIKLETTSARVLTDRPVYQSDDGRQVARLLSAHICTAGYIISRDCARRLYSETEFARTSIDELMFNPEHELFDTLITYQISPALCKQALITSTIERYEVPSMKVPVKIRREVLRPLTQVFRLMTRLWIWQRYRQSLKRISYR